jgi:hypothetical protein
LISPKTVPSEKVAVSNEKNHHAAEKSNKNDLVERPKSAHPVVMAARPINIVKENQKSDMNPISKHQGDFFQSKEKISQMTKRPEFKPFSSEGFHIRAADTHEYSNPLIHQLNKAILLNVRGYEHDTKNNLNSQSFFKSNALSIQSPSLNQSKGMIFFTIIQEELNIKF